jgi:hypothetical protein
MKLGRSFGNRGVTIESHDCGDQLPDNRVPRWLVIAILVVSLALLLVGLVLDHLHLR